MPVTTAAVVLAAAQAVTFATKDGWTIAAAYRPASAGNATVVLAHGVGSAGVEWNIQQEQGDERPPQPP